MLDIWSCVRVRVRDEVRVNPLSPHARHLVMRAGERER